MAPMADVAMAWLTGPSDQGAAGTSVASPGDINQDGYDDLLIGAPGVDGGRGAGFVVLGPVEDEASLADVAYEELGESASDAAGAAVAGPGDVDGDGVVDMLIGAPGAGGGVGCAYLYLGGGI